MGSHRSEVFFISFEASSREHQVVEKHVHALTPFAHIHQLALATQMQLVRRDANICVRVAITSNIPIFIAIYWLATL